MNGADVIPLPSAFPDVCDASPECSASWHVATCYGFAGVYPPHVPPAGHTGTREGIVDGPLPPALDRLRRFYEEAAARSADTGSCEVCASPACDPECPVRPYRTHPDGDGDPDGPSALDVIVEVADVADDALASVGWRVTLRTVDRPVADPDPDVAPVNRHDRPLYGMHYAARVVLRTAAPPFPGQRFRLRLDHVEAHS